jgi:6-phosphogluconolactonase (cycloisomerase 2 family)
MRLTGRIALAGGSGLAAAALFAVPAGATPAAHPHHHDAHRAGRTVFVQTDNPAGNSIVVYHRAGDGTLSRRGSYSTGGLGGVLAGSVVDHLASQGSLTYDRAHRLLYAVNAGSNTITVFTADGGRLHRRQVLSSGGTFPVSIATHGRLVYVLNARDGGSIQGFVRAGHHLVRVPAWQRPLGLDPAQTPEFTSTPGQVAFTPDGSKLVVTTKNNLNQIDVFTLDRSGGPAAGSPVVTPDPGNVPFAVAFDAFGRLQVAEAGPNAVATYRVDPDGSLTFRGRVPTGQAATCWITTTGRELFLGNAGSGTVSRFHVAADGVTNQGTASTDAGTVDLAVSHDGRNLYAQTGAAGIVDEFAIGQNGTLSRIGSVLVPGAVGGQGIATS